MTGRSTGYTAELRKAKDEGAKIVCAMQPYEGREVDYVPRRAGDPQPWLLRVGPGDFYRYNGRECRAEGPSGGPWRIARLLP